MSDVAVEDPLFSQQQAANYMGVTTRSIREYIARGELKASRVRSSRLIRIRKSDLDAMLRPIPTVRGVA